MSTMPGTMSDCPHYEHMTFSLDSSLIAIQTNSKETRELGEIIVVSSVPLTILWRFACAGRTRTTRDIRLAFITLSDHTHSLVASWRPSRKNTLGMIRGWNVKSGQVVQLAAHREELPSFLLTNRSIICQEAPLTPTQKSDSVILLDDRTDSGGFSWIWEFTMERERRLCFLPKPSSQTFPPPITWKGSRLAYIPHTHECAVILDLERLRRHAGPWQPTTQEAREEFEQLIGEKGEWDFPDCMHDVHD